MRVLPGLGLLAVAQGGTFPDAPSASYEAEISILASGLTQTGKISWDAEGKRSYTYINELEQSTFQIQDQGQLSTLTYNVIPTKPNPTCVCTKTPGQVVGNPWYWFLGGEQNSTGCSGGTLYSNPMKGYPGTGVNQPSTSICINGQTPVFTDDGASKVTYTSFTAGRPKNFNLTALEPFLPGCAQNCNYGKATEYSIPYETFQKAMASKAMASPKLKDLPGSPADSFSADVTFTSGPVTDKGTYAVDTVARRSYMYHAGSEATKLVIQDVGHLDAFVYTIIQTQPNPTCVCKRFTPRGVVSPWFTYLDGVSNSTGCSGGSLFTNDMKAYPSAGAQSIPNSICMNGDTPVWSEGGNTRTTYDTFTAGRPDAWNVSALTAFLPVCVRDCNVAAEGETINDELFRILPRANKKQTAPKKAAGTGNWPQSPASSFSADITITSPGGQSSKGTMIWDSVARRAYTYNADSQATKITLQNVNNMIQSYVYTVIPTQPSPTCACDILESSDVADPWYIFMGGAMNSTGCSGGTLYTNLMEGFAGSGILPQPSSICMSGSTPVYSEHGSSRVTYDTFTAGRTTDWNTTALEQFLPSCSSTCVTTRGQGVFQKMLF